MAKHFLKSVATLNAAILLSLFAIAPSEVFAARSRAGIRCEELFVTFAATVVTTSPVRTSNGKTSTAVVPTATTGTRLAALHPTLNGEMTVMRFQFSQGGGPAPLISSDHIPDLFRLHGVAGDPVFPRADGDYVRIRFSSQPVGRTAPEGLAQAEKLAGPRPPLKLSNSEIDQVIEQFMRREYHDLQVGPKEWQAIFSAAKALPNTVKQAVDAFERGALALPGPAGSRLLAPPKTANTQLSTANREGAGALATRPAELFETELTTAGRSRYFRFTPQGTSHEVSARVLDIHMLHRGGAHVYAEWISHGSNGQRVREVGDGSLAELKTIGKLSSADRFASASDFFDSLTPNQLAIQMMASKLKLQARGYTDFMRAPGMMGQNSYLITEKMGNAGHFSVRGETEALFGAFDYLLTPAERANANWNAIDVFGRLSPEFVLKKFGSKGGFKYMFVITEDGQLKISPLGSSDSNLRPQLLRLGHGRKVLSAGTFNIDLNGQVHITRRSADYSSYDGAMVSGATENPAENFVIRAAFRMQGATETASINSASPDLWHEVRFNEENGLYENVRTAKAKAEEQKQGPFQEYGSQEAADYINELMRAKHVQEDVVADWGREKLTEKPPTFEEWAKLAGRTSELASGHDTAAKLSYGHYVLGTNPNQTFAEIRKTYRNLQAKFYPRNGEGNDVASQRINDAFRMFKEKEQQ